MEIDLVGADAAIDNAVEDRPRLDDQQVVAGAECDRGSAAAADRAGIADGVVGRIVEIDAGPAHADMGDSRNRAEIGYCDRLGGCPGGINPIISALDQRPAGASRAVGDAAGGDGDPGPRPRHG
ncbi:MAG: hypothetical protein ACREFH_13105, partial [Stellaceae bacterium]